MERGGRSGERSPIVAKTPRSSWGCLNLKEKSDGLCRTVSSTEIRRSFQKKRSEVSDSESSDEFMKPPPRRVDRKTLGAKGSSKEKFARKNDRAEHDLNVFVRRNNEASGSLRKVKKWDVFEFDVYNVFDNANLMRKRFDNGSVGVSGRISFAPRRVDSSEPIRVQGRNGVLKVRVNNKTSTLPASINRHEAEIYESPPFSRKGQKREYVVVEPTFRKSNNVDKYSESEESDMSRKSKRRKPECLKSKTEVNTKSKSPFSEPVKPVVREERRGRRSGGTEKQRLRERIKGMLTDAGWTIDYRPRRNQSYVDAVYVNPSGSAYWSIIKAYDALLKQLKEEDIDARSRKDAAAVASVSEDIVNNLARKVKKTRAEMSKKRENDTNGSDSEKESDGDDESINHDQFNPSNNLYGPKAAERADNNGYFSDHQFDLVDSSSPSTSVMNHNPGLVLPTDFNGDAETVGMENNQQNQQEDLPMPWIE